MHRHRQIIEIGDERPVGVHLHFAGLPPHEAFDG
jgi:hypothetical protein